MTDTATALAYHWREAAENERAVHFLLVAAEHAGRGWAKQDAVALYREALSLVPQEEEERRRDISRLQALAATALYHLPDATRLAQGATVDPSDVKPS